MDDGLAVAVGGGTIVGSVVGLGPASLMHAPATMTATASSAPRCRIRVAVVVIGQSSRRRRRTLIVSLMLSIP